MRNHLVSGLLIILSLLYVCPVSHAEQTDALEDVLAPHYIVVDQNDPSIVFYEHNADEKCIPGSTMKIMTCILALENCPDLEQTVEVSGRAASLKSSNSLMGAMRGEILSIRQLLYGLMLESGNDAALQLATTISGDAEQFAALMNQKAAALGMVNTHFVNASGVYKRDQYSTARDMAILTCYAMQNETFREIVSTARYDIEPNNVRKRTLKMINGNRLIADDVGTGVHYAFATGVKTGSTAQGGKCLAASASKDDTSVVCIMLGAVEGGSKLERMTSVFEDAARVMELTLSTRYSNVSLADLGVEYETETTVSGGAVASVPVQARLLDETFVTLPDVVVDRIKQDPGLIETVASPVPLEAPVEAGAPCGSVSFDYNGHTLASVDLVAKSAVFSPSPAPIETIPTPTPVIEDIPIEANVTARAVVPFPRIALAIFCGLSAIALQFWIALRLKKLKKAKNNNTFKE